MLVGAVDGDDVRVPDARERPRLVEEACPVDERRLEQLHRDAVIQPCVARVVDLAEGPLAQLPQQLEMTPVAEGTVRCGRGRGGLGGRRGDRLLGGDRRVGTMDFGDARHHPEDGEQTTLLIVHRGCVGGVPIDGGAVGD